MNRREVKKAPVLRFKGFTNDWEQRKFTELGKLYYGKSAPKWSVVEKGGTPCIRYGELYTKYSSKIDNVYSHTSIDKSKLKFSTGNELLIPRVGEEPLDFAKHTSWLSIPNVAIGEMITVLKTKENPLFLANYLRAKYVFKFARLVEGGNVSNLYFERYEDTNILIPSKNEQQNISKLILKIDKLITLQQRKNILLYKLRKSLLSTLLTDKCTPKVRFKSFLEPLKKQKLGDMAPLRGGFAFKANNYVNTGIPIIRISNILSNGSIGGNFAYYSEQSDDSNYILFNGSALIAMSGATTGKTAILDLEKKKKVYQNQRVGYFTPTKNSDYSFIKAIIKSNYFLKQLNSIMVAGAQPNVSAVDIDNFTFYFPESKKEQKYIGNNFEVINKIILLQKNRVDKLKKLKRSLLQQLFI